MGKNFYSCMSWWSVAIAAGLLIGQGLVKMRDNARIESQLVDSEGDELSSSIYFELYKEVSNLRMVDGKAERDVYILINPRPGSKFKITAMKYLPISYEPNRDIVPYKSNYRFIESIDKCGIRTFKHDLHSALVPDSKHLSKPIYIDKPTMLVITFRSHPGCNYMVTFNPRFQYANTSACLSSLGRDYDIKLEFPYEEEFELANKER